MEKDETNSKTEEEAIEISDEQTSNSGNSHLFSKRYVALVLSFVMVISTLFFLNITYSKCKDILEVHIFLSDDRFDPRQFGPIEQMKMERTLIRQQPWFFSQDFCPLFGFTVSQQTNHGNRSNVSVKYIVLQKGYNDRRTTII